MSIQNPYQSYQQNSIQTASPGELTLMLYNGCIKSIKQAKQAMQEKRMEDKNTHIIKAQDIIRELMVTLNPEIEISQSMLPLYDYMLHRLIEANTQNDQEILAEVEEYAVQFRGTWKQVLQEIRKQHHGGGTHHVG